MFWNKNKNSHPDNIQLGDLVRDRITGFEGVVECISEWLNSCRRITVKPIFLKDGVTVKNETFDAPQLEVIEAGYFDKPVIRKGEKTGGPSISPKRND
jgi:hypothetical protein